MIHKYYVHIQASGQQDYRSKYHKQSVNKVKKSKDDKYVIDITLNSKQNDSSRRKVKPNLDNNIPVKDYFSVKTRSQSKKNKEV